jgi:hypothetical protein
MVDLRDPNVATLYHTRTTTGWRTPSPKVEGVMLGTVLDGPMTNSAVPEGSCRITISTFGSAVYGPIVYPGTIEPPPGTQVVVAFQSPAANSQSATVPYILCYLDWPPVSG